MSIESANSFIERMKTDEKFAKKITACKDVEERSVVMREEGFDFTASELREAQTVLSDEDLECVAGGVNLSRIDITIV